MMAWIDGAEVLTAEQKVDNIKSRNKEKALAAQAEIIDKHLVIQAKKSLGVTDTPDFDQTELSTFVQALEVDINNPSEDEAYFPPLPPSVVMPDAPDIIATVTREPGWNSVLGWRLTLDIADPEYVPSSFAISLYNAADCTNYSYTLGAFQFDSETGKYFVVCSPGQEMGDVDYHFGLLYAAANISCWTLVAGEQSKTIQIFGD